MSTETAASTIKNRTEIATEHTWNLERIYPSISDFERELEEFTKLGESLAKQQGKLTTSAALAEFYTNEDKLHRLAGKLRSYSSHRADEDTEVTANQSRKSLVQSRGVEVFSKLAWVRPELLSLDTATLKAWQGTPEMKPYVRAIDLLLRQKPHTLSTAEETLLSQAGEIFMAPYETFSLLTNADLKFPQVADSKGNMHELTNGRYGAHMQNPDRTLRHNAFKALYDTYAGFRNTTAKTLSSSVKVMNFDAKVRKFDSALDAALHPNNLPKAIYTTLIETVHSALPTFYDYLEVRRRALGLDALNMWDMHVAIVPEYHLEIPYEKAVEWVKAAMKPMGAEYMQAVEECFAQRWIDVYENKGKLSGAYSGGCYDSSPYILLNYQGTLNDVFTLAHELGHSVHSWLANKYQTSRHADYTIFVAEIASTTAENLLTDYLIKTTDDVRLKAYVLNHLCDSYRGTIYRQTMFAEYEKAIYEADAAGTPLTADWMSETYYELNAKFYGPNVNADRRIAGEFARIPHFYYNFYVYQYSTGFIAALLFCQQILSGEKGCEQYLDMLRLGGSKDPLDAVRQGGVDLADRKVLEAAFVGFAKASKELDALLVSMK